MNRGYKFRIYPSAEQKVMFAKTFGCVRFVYNRMLSDKLEKKKLVTPAQYKDEFEWLREVDSLALCNAQMNLKRAFENRRKNPKYFGEPCFKSKKNRQSYSTNNQKGSVRIEGEKIRLPKVGLVKIKLHRHAERQILREHLDGVRKSSTSDSAEKIFGLGLLNGGTIRIVGRRESQLSEILSSCRKKTSQSAEEIFAEQEIWEQPRKNTSSA